MVVSEERPAKHVNDFPELARQPPIETIEKMWGAVFSVVSVPRLYNGDPRPANGKIFTILHVIPGNKYIYIQYVQDLCQSRLSTAEYALF
jgi:hypothetical protein